MESGTTVGHNRAWRDSLLPRQASNHKDAISWRKLEEKTMVDPPSDLSSLFREDVRELLAGIAVFGFALEHHRPFKVGHAFEESRFILAFEMAEYDDIFEPVLSPLSASKTNGHFRPYKKAICPMGS